MSTRSTHLRRIILGAALAAPLLSAAPARAQELPVPFVPILMCAERMDDTYYECIEEREDGLWGRIICKYESIFDFVFCLIGH